MNLEFLIIAVVLRNPDKSIAECAAIAAATHAEVLKAIEAASVPTSPRPTE